MNRLDKKFKILNKKNKKAFIVYITAGDPSLKITEKLVLELEKSGADIIELGVPFSDPLADGPTIQRASCRALSGGATLRNIINLVKRLRKKTQIPIVFMTYYNPVFRYGVERFIKDAVAGEVDGVVVADLPPEEASDLIRYAKRNNFSVIFLLSPTSTQERIKLISGKSTGFIYFVSLTGVTGARERLPTEATRQVRLIKRYTKKPVCVGFGISKPQHVKNLYKIADGVIVGSAVVKVIEDNLKKKDLVKCTGRFVRYLSSAKGNKT